MSDPEKIQRLDDLFRSSKGEPVEWAGRTVRMACKISVGDRFERAKISVHSFEHEPTQGICLRLKGGQLEVEGQRNDGMVFWMDTAPAVIYVGISGESNSVLEVWNCWRGRFGEQAAWLGSAGLIADARNDHDYHFSCSDGPGEADFTALEFELELELCS